ncbi:AMP-binding protein [Rhodospira trueperi]|uniref:Fatty-acyl-CoA synthase n=1 Tax=Rhodospira trueperi TaxID=69960 RepID=A0A1G7GFN5_9PROT|nr:AMP-binding protein [Rhodospira trueperi]SDE86957.1 fatty-acyl-CoA synthase [Rhodospira trueperi]
MDRDLPRLDALLDPWRAAHGDAVVFVEEDGGTVTIRHFDALVAATEAWLLQAGIKPGDRVAVWLPNRIEWLALLFALARVGATLVAVNTRYRSAELTHILTASGARLLIMQPGFRRIDFRTVVAGIDPAGLPDLKAVAILSDTGETLERVLDRPTVPFRPVTEAPPPGPDTTSDPAAPLVLFTTSGTTKAPKLVVHPQHTLARHSLRAAHAYGFDVEGSGFLTAMPFCGVFGLNGVLAALAGRARIHLSALFDAADAAARVEQHRITHLIGSDEMFRRLIECGADRLASTRLCGFASFTPGLGDLLRKAAERGLPLAGLYGSSEINAIFAIQPMSLPPEDRLKGGGRPASGGAADVRVRDMETGALLPPFETGELEVRAPTNFTGYYNNPDATREAVDPEGFFRTGDVGYVRDDGTFVYVARRGDAIRLAGFLVDPAEIEDALKTIDGVDDAQVVGVEQDGGTRPVAFVIPDGQTPFEERRVIDAAADILAAFKVPIRVLPIDAFPIAQSANGPKIQRVKLRQMAAECVAQE